jgi:hypothetical protein
MDCVLSFFLPLLNKHFITVIMKALLNAQIAKSVIINYGICLLIAVSIVQLVKKHLFAKNGIQNGGTLACNTVMVSIVVIISHLTVSFNYLM